MFSQFTHTIIDTVQSGKKQFVNLTVKHEEARNILNSFVDAQTAYTKEMFDSSMDVFNSFNNLVFSKNFHEHAKDMINLYK